MRSQSLMVLVLLGAAVACAEPLCIEDGYDPLSVERERFSALPQPGIVLTVDPERADPWWLNDPERSWTAHPDR